MLSFQVDSKIPPSWAQEGFLVWEAEFTTTEHAQWELELCLRCSPALPGKDDSFWSRSRQILSPSYPTKVTTTPMHRQHWESWFSAFSSLKGVETGGQTQKKQSAQQDSVNCVEFTNVLRSSGHMQLPVGKWTKRKCHKYP